MGFLEQTLADFQALWSEAKKEARSLSLSLGLKVPKVFQESQVNTTGYSPSSPIGLGLLPVVMAFVIGVILIFNVALPLLNSVVSSTGSVNASTVASNVTSNGYDAANTIGSMVYIVTVLSVLGIAAFVVMMFFRGGI